MTLTLDQVRHVAKLSELELTEGELQTMTRDLSAILAHVDQLQALVTEGSPSGEASGSALPLRPDEPHPGIRHEDALRQAPKPLDGGFAVPGFVED
jgi:aspartyl-tRNA(Asn)/glutamyl-tRNA(Gln) amidotransferase subunit C